MKSYDLTGIRCPMPIVELNRLVQDLDDGEEFTVTADDPAFDLDLPAWCRRTGHEVVSQQSEAGVARCVVRVRKQSPCPQDR